MFKQPRVPEYRERDEPGRYLRELTLFLRDFCLNSWKAAASLEKRISRTGDIANMTLEELDESLERLHLDKEHPVGGAPYVTLLPQEEDDPNVKWPWSTWLLDTSGRFLLGASDAHPLGETGGSETHTLTEDELPKITGTVSLGAGAAGAEAGGYGAVRTTSGAISGSVAMQYGRPTIATSAAYSAGSYRDAVLSFGGGAAHGIMPPYRTVNIWVRTA